MKKALCFALILLTVSMSFSSCGLITIGALIVKDKLEADIHVSESGVVTRDEISFWVEETIIWTEEPAETVPAEDYTAYIGTWLVGDKLGNPYEGFTYYAYELEIGKLQNELYFVLYKNTGVRAYDYDSAKFPVFSGFIDRTTGTCTNSLPSNYEDSDGFVYKHNYNIMLKNDVVIIQSDDKGAPEEFKTPVIASIKED